MNGTAILKHNDAIWGSAISSTKKELFYLVEYDPINQYLFTMQCTDRQLLITWHCRLRHINGHTIRSMTSKVTGMVVGDLPSNIGERNIECADCLRVTPHQIISRYPFTPAKGPLARVSTDLSVLMRLPHCTWGYRYLLVIIDHFSRYIWVFPLISKAMTLRAMRIFQSSTENQSNAKLLVLQTDGGEEFAGKEFAKWT